VLEVPAPLRRICTSLEGVSQVIERGAVPPPFDLHCPLMSLPLACNTTLTTVPASIPYLSADPEKLEVWRAKLGASRSLRVGLVWSGGSRPDHPELWSVNRRRNIPLSILAALGGANAEFFSLQKPESASHGAPASDGGWIGTPLVDCTALLEDFSDTAALIGQLDLVISVDTSTAHLAAALGKPVWLLNRHNSCWRWLLGRSDSPWYPTLRIYRQPAPGDWNSVVARVRQDLDRLIAG
jgi:hypothetical protein